MSGDFEPDLDWSHSVAGEPFWLDVYRRAFPGFVAAHIPVGDGWHQRAGRDRIVVLDDSSTITIDEKGRREEWPDILLEIFSDRDREIPGWANPKKALNCDYIGYAFVPTQTCHLLPYRELRRIMANGPGGAWWREARRKEREGRRDGIHFVDARNPRNPRLPVRYWTRSIAVPISTLLAAISASLTIVWTTATPEPARLCVTCDLPEDKWDPTHPLYSEGSAQCPGCAQADAEEGEGTQEDCDWPEPAKPGGGIPYKREG